MAAKVAVAVSKGRSRLVRQLVCLFMVETLTLLILTQCGDGDVVPAMREIATLVAP